MARTIRTARRRLGARATPAEVVREYRNYGMVRGDNLVEFLSHYHRLWEDAHEFSATNVDGVRRLVTRMPPDWEGYAREISGDFIYRREDSYDLVADLPRFVSHLSYVAMVYGNAPRGPYLPPREFTWQDTTPDWLYLNVPRASMDVVPHILPIICRNDHEAGPSCRVVREAPAPPPRMLEAPPPPLPNIPPMPVPPPPMELGLPSSHFRVVERQDGTNTVREIYALVGSSAAQAHADDEEEEEDPEEDVGSSTGDEAMEH